MKNKNILPVLSVICIIAVVGMMLALIFGGKESAPPEFIPPAFDNTVQSGMPEASDQSWTKIYQDGMSFTAYVCGRIAIADGSADMFFTSVADNTVWLKLRITDDKGNILGETGLIKPGEYVKTVSFTTVPAVGSNVKLRIMSYEPDTYYSAGAVTLNTVISG